MSISRLENTQKNINSYQNGEFKKVTSNGIKYNTPFGVWTFYKSNSGFIGYLENHKGEICQFGEHTRKDWTGGRNVTNEENVILKSIAMDAVQKEVTKWN